MAGEIYKKPITLAIMATVAILIGSVVTMAYPMLRADMHPRLETLRPFTPLQLAGRDIYQREGCVGCHTQTIRPLPSEVARYGDYSKAGEFAYDHPFLWGSKRTGPDLAREGGLRPDGWHYQHYASPQALFPRSNMPAYGWLKGRPLDAVEVLGPPRRAGLGPPGAEDRSRPRSRRRWPARTSSTRWWPTPSSSATRCSARQAGTVDLTLGTRWATIRRRSRARQEALPGELRRLSRR